MAPRGGQLEYRFVFHVKKLTLATGIE